MAAGVILALVGIGLNNYVVPLIFQAKKLSLSQGGPVDLLAGIRDVGVTVELDGVPVRSI